LSVLAQAAQQAQEPAKNGLSGYIDTSPINPAILPLVAGIAVGIVVMLILIISRYSDQETKGFLTISLLIVFSFIMAAFASMVYQVPTNPATEILVGALSTALGAIISHWVGRMKPMNEKVQREKDQEHKKGDEE